MIIFNLLLSIKESNPQPPAKTLLKPWKALLPSAARPTAFGAHHLHAAQSNRSPPALRVQGGVTEEPRTAEGKEARQGPASSCCWNNLNRPRFSQWAWIRDLNGTLSWKGSTGIGKRGGMHLAKGHKCLRFDAHHLSTDTSTDILYHSSIKQCLATKAPGCLPHTACQESPAKAPAAPAPLHSSQPHRPSRAANEKLRAATS